MRFSLFGYIGFVLLATIMAPAQAEHEREITCMSENHRFQRCSLASGSKVILSRQLSDAPCIRGITWGVDRKGLWVKRGCRASFRVVVEDIAERSIVCKSENFRYQHCRANIYGKVRLLKQYSDSPCIFGRTWGFEKSGIWVKSGCQGRFGISRADHDYAQTPPPQARPVRTVICSSKNYRYQFCRVNTRGGVILARQLSDASCKKGRTWGFEKSGIWVKEGCSGRFRIGR